MGILPAGLFGALGGLCFEALVWYGRLAAWQVARKQSHERGKRDEQLPKLGHYIDIPADSLALVTRVVLGAMTGVLLNSQINGPVAAMLLGAAAPTLLSQLGRVSTAQSALAIGKEDAALGPRAPAPAPENAAEVEAP